MVPHQVKKMTDRYKEMCDCTDCVSIGYFHSDNNTFISLFGSDLKKKRDSYLCLAANLGSMQMKNLQSFLINAKDKRDQKMY